MEPIKFRCSALGKIMGSAGKALPVGAKTYCRELFLEQKYGRTKEFTSKYTDKGNAVEQDAIDMLNRLLGTSYVKNEQNLSNDYLTGTPDIIGDVIVDIKSPWDLHTYFEGTQKLNSDYIWQVHGYMALTGLKMAYVSLCLMNAPAQLVQDAVKRLYFQMGCPDEIDNEYREKALQIERNMIFDVDQFAMDNPHVDLISYDSKYNIPEHERLHTFEVPYEQERIDQIYERIDQCRQYIKTLS